MLNSKLVPSDIKRFNNVQFMHKLFKKSSNYARKIIKLEK